MRKARLCLFFPEAAAWCSAARRASLPRCTYGRGRVREGADGRAAAAGRSLPVLGRERPKGVERTTAVVPRTRLPWNRSPGALGGVAARPKGVTWRGAFLPGLSRGQRFHSARRPWT